jgi:hypothetical protein
MMKTDVDGLMTFLNENAESDEAKALVAEQEPLLRRLAGIAESGGWPLAKNPDRERLARLAVDVAALSGRKVSRCATVEASDPFPQPKRVGRAYQASVWDGLGDSLGKTLLWGELDNLVPNQLLYSVLSCLEADLCAGLRYSFRAIFQNSIWICLEARLWETLRMTLFLYVGFILVGDLERTERLSRIVEAFADGVMPIGFKADKPDALLFVHA